MIKPSPHPLSEDALQPARPLAPGDPLYDAWAANLEFFREIRPQLLQDPRLMSKYVAIHDRQVIDSDSDEFVLASRMYERMPRENFFIAKVDAHDPVVELPSPEVA
jgi:hypothetical protein